MIYFIRAGNGPVKIGHSHNPNARLAALQSGNYEKLKIIASIDGGHSLEKALHEHFNSKQLSGEWFTLTDEEIGKIIFSILSGVFTWEELPQDEELDEIDRIATKYEQARN